MAQTTRSNLIVPEILADTIRTGFAGMKALYGTGAAIINNSLPGDKGHGDTVTVPYFANMGELEDVSEGQPLSLARLTASRETATVERSGLAFELTRWAQLAAAGDPYAEASRQLTEATQRHADKALITTAAGTTLTSALGTAKISYDAVVDAKMLWGDEQEDIALMAVHSKTLGSLLKLKDSSGRPLVTDMVGTSLQKFVNIPLVVSDRLPADSNANSYTSLLIKKNALVFWYSALPSVRTQGDVLKDTDMTSVNVYWVAYMYKNMPGLTKPGVVKITHGN